MTSTQRHRAIFTRFLTTIDRASFACEGIYFTPEDEALFEQMDRERLTPDERVARIKVE